MTLHAFLLNGFRLTLSKDVIDCCVEPFPDNKLLRDVRKEKGNQWFIHWRNGLAYGIPRVPEPAIEFGKKQDLSCADHLWLLASRLDDVLPDKFPKYEALKRRPLFVFRGQKGELIAQIKSKLRNPERLAGFAVHPEFWVDSKVVESTPGESFIGLFFGLKTRWAITAQLTTLRDAGIDLSGLYIVRRNRQPGERKLIGRIRSLEGDKVLLSEAFDDLQEISIADVALESRKEVFIRCLRGVLKADYLPFEQALRDAQSSLLTGPSVNARLKQFEDYFAKSPTFEIAPDLTATFGERIRVQNKGSYRSVVIAPPVKYCYDAARSHQAELAWKGIQEFGPFSRSTFSKRSPNILVVFPDTAQGAVEKFVRYLRDGIRPAYAGGFAKLFALANPSFLLCRVSLLGLASVKPGLLYKQILEATLRGMETQPDAAIVVLTDEHADLPDPDGPYIQSKAFLMLAGIPTQKIRVSKLSLPEQQLQYVLQNISTALYAKLNGTPWTVDQDKTVSDELVIGIGTSELLQSRVMERERFVGITTVFRGDGNYLLGHISKECAYSEYADVLRLSTIAVLEEIKKRNGWMPGDRVRIIFHSSKPFKNVEVADIVKECVATVGKEQDVEFAFLTVTLDHPFVVFDPNQNGIGDRYGRLKGVMVPERGTILEIGRYTRLLCTNGPRLIKLEKAPLPSPLLISIHKQSDFVDLAYLSEQVLKFTSLSWRSTLPAKKPVSIYYSELIAELLARLRKVPSWSPDSLNIKLRASRWFL